MVSADEVRPEWTVNEVLDRSPGSAATFVRLRTACVGCMLARFCTLADVCAAYGIPLPTLLSALDRVELETDPSRDPTRFSLPMPRQEQDDED